MGRPFSSPGYLFPMKEPRILSFQDAPELGHAVPGALDTFPFKAMDRAAGAPVVPGNRIALQFEGPLTFDAWI